MNFRRRRHTSGTSWFRLISELYPGPYVHTPAPLRCQEPSRTFPTVCRRDAMYGRAAPGDGQLNDLRRRPAAQRVCVPFTAVNSFPFEGLNRGKLPVYVWF
jgi:hypothetical protein